MYRAYLGMLAQSSGSGFRAGMRVPTDDYDGLMISCSVCLCVGNYNNTSIMSHLV
jgi:hypothetical protein